MTKKKKWYVVWQGRIPGVYESWDKCNEQVYRFSGAQYKSYASKLQAENAFKNANYVIWRGRKPGVYQGWEECRKQIEGFEGAKYRSFPSLEAAQLAFESWDEETEEFDRLVSSEEQHIRSILNETFPAGQQEPLIVTSPILESLSVDAACSDNPGLMEYRGVKTNTGEQLFRQGPFSDGTNNVGEFLALVHALAYLKKQGTVIPIYSDSKIAINWVKAGKCKTRLERTDNNSKLFDLIERAESWLLQNEFENKIYKWDTKMWGEIPADFGRK
jgi:ribonuclease HI